MPENLRFFNLERQRLEEGIFIEDIQGYFVLGTNGYSLDSLSELLRNNSDYLVPVENASFIGVLVVRRQF
jgi:hypothetical protein